MKVVYTKHAEDKLKRRDIKDFGVAKTFIEESVTDLSKSSKTKSGESAVVVGLHERHELRVIYDIIEGKLKVITFHIAKKGRYR